MVKAARDWVDVSEMVRFIIAGGTNTLLTLAIYQGLLFVVSYGMAYAISWIIGVLFSAVVYPNRVFRAPNASSFIRVAAVVIFIAVYFAGVTMLHLLQSAGVNPRVGIFVVLPITASLGYGSLRVLFHLQRRRAP